MPSSIGLAGIDGPGFSHARSTAKENSQSRAINSLDQECRWQSSISLVVCSISYKAHLPLPQNSSGWLLRLTSEKFEMVGNPHLGLPSDASWLLGSNKFYGPQYAQTCVSDGLNDSLRRAIAGAHQGGRVSLLLPS